MNEDIAGRLDEVAHILVEQGANPYRVQAYHHAAVVLRGLARPVAEIFASEGLAGLVRLPGVGETIARAIRDIIQHGRLAMLDRLRGEHDAIALLTSVPGIGKSLAWKLHDDLGLESLEELETAAHDGRLESIAGLGAKRLAGIRDSLAHRLGRIRRQPPVALLPGEMAEPSVQELLAVDDEYRRGAAAGTLKRIAPRRFNPSGEAWLPVLHTTRGQRHYNALFSNTAHAHAQGKSRDWVVIFYDGHDGERQCTVITSEFGRLKGLRIVRGREDECEAWYRERGLMPGSGQMHLVSTLPEGGE
ncbi:MAG: helix-hairpin-helix domain-containing protein [Limisphaerales bacterium]